MKKSLGGKKISKFSKFLSFFYCLPKAKIVYVMSLIVFFSYQGSLLAEGKESVATTIIENYNVDSVMNTLATGAITAADEILKAKGSAHFNKKLASMNYFPADFDIDTITGFDQSNKVSPDVIGSMDETSGVSSFSIVETIRMNRNEQTTVPFIPAFSGGSSSGSIGSFGNTSDQNGNGSTVVPGGPRDGGDPSGPPSVGGGGGAGTGDSVVTGSLKEGS